MRRILIDDRIANLARRYSEKVCTESRSNRVDMPLARLRALYSRLYKQEQYHRHAIYVWNIIVYYREILRLEPQEFFEYYINYFSDLAGDEMLQKIRISDKSNEGSDVKIPQDKQFNELVQWAMRYKDLRAVEYMHYLRELNIRTCVYCNAQYAIVVEDTKDNGEEKKVALFQLDHFWPKSKYPFLCTTFFNLHPCCANCNLHKSDKKSEFNLYTRDEKDLNPFWFELESGESIDGVRGYNCNDLNITLQSHNKKLLANLQKHFLIDKIYKHHYKEVQETIVRLKINDEAYRRQLSTCLDSLFPDGVEHPERFFWGHEMNEECVHERPLNKLVQDTVAFYKE